MTKVDVDQRATSDLISHVDYLSDYSRAAAERLVSDYEAVVAQLRTFPESGARSHDDPELRLVRRGRHVYVYSYQADTGVLLLRILAGAQQGRD